MQKKQLSGILEPIASLSTTTNTQKSSIKSCYLISLLVSF